MKDKVINILSEISGFGTDKIYPEACLKNDLGLDSLDMFNLALELEGELGENTIPDKVIENWKTVQDVIDYCESLNTKGQELAEDLDKRLE